MPELKFTDEQKAVINAGNCSLLVSAAAGSGKTAVLVERLMRLITDKENPSSLDRMLVMTFTRAAADGMRKKIRNALTEKKAELEREEAPDEGLISHINTQLSILPRARISTIDSICQGMVRQYFQYIDVDPAFRAADEEELKLIKKDVIRKLLEEKYDEGSSTFIHLSESFTKNGLDENLSELIERVYAFAEAKPWPERFLGSLKADALLDQSGRIEEAEWFRNFLRNIKTDIEIRKHTAEDLTAENSGPDGWTPYLPQLSFYAETCEKLLSCEGYGEMREVLGSICVPRISSKKCPDGDPVKQAAVKRYHEEIKDYLKKLKEQTFASGFDEVVYACSNSASDVIELIELTLSFIERFTEKKKASGIIDFNDMEHLALCLLYEEDLSFTPLADELAESFDQIMVDEYQDSNEVQEALIKALNAERFGRPDVFMVGDVKQSIYMFRQADPGLFMEKHRTYETYEGSTAVNRKIELNRNFRSTREVIESINDIFRRIMLPETGGIAYDDNAALYPGRKDQQDRKGDDPELKTELLLLDTSDKETDCGGFTDTELEFRMITERIKELISGKWHKKDITVLMRSAKDAELLCRMLTESGIDAYFDAGSGYFDSVEVGVMLSFLDIVDNPRQDIPLAAVLRSPAGKFTDDDLAELRFAYGVSSDDEMPALYECLLNAASDDGGRLYAAASEFLERLNGFRSLSGNIPVHELIYRIFRETGYYDYVLSLPGGKRRRRNLDLLLQKAEDYSSGSYHGLFNFTRYIEQLKKYDTDYGEAPSVSENDDTVLITTIHKSKGLEYPVVFVAETGKKFNQQDLKGSLVMNGSCGIACDYFDVENRLRYPSVKKEYIKAAAKRDSMGEELRVLYVAMTRAQEKLIITGQISKDREYEGTAGSVDIEKAANELSLILLGGAQNCSSIAVKTHLRAEFAEKSAETAEMSSSEEKTGNTAAETAEELLPYPYTEETLLKPKVSVSELKAAVIMENELQFVRDLEERKEVKGAEFGTLVHRAFEILDYSLPADSCIPELPGADRNTFESIKRIIKRFRESELGCIMCRAALGGRLKREQHFMAGFPACEINPDIHSEELQLIQGIIDAYIVNENGIILVDYKTDRVDSEEELVKRYALQLELYKKALEQLLRKPVVQCLIYSTRLEKMIEI